MRQVGDEMLMAWVDGELDEVAARRLALAIAADAELKARADEQERLRERLARRYGAIAEEEVPERLRAMLESKVVPLTAVRRPRPLWVRAAALAATFLAGFVAAELLPREGGGDLTGGAPMIAAGPLADALDRQLASDQPRDATTRIGVSFASRDGRLCRTYQAGASAGLACRGDGGWELMATARVPVGEPDGEYRQAASGSALVMQAAQELMAGDAFDEGAERRAREAGWRRP